MDAIRGAREASQGGVEPTGAGGRGGAPPTYEVFTCAISRIPAPHLLKQGQLQLAGASFRDNPRPGTLNNLIRKMKFNKREREIRIDAQVTRQTKQTNRQVDKQPSQTKPNQPQNQNKPSRTRKQAGRQAGRQAGKNAWPHHA